MSDNVRDRAREALAMSMVGYLVAVNKHGRVDDVALPRHSADNLAKLGLAALDAAGIVLVDAQVPDLRQVRRAAMKHISFAWTTDALLAGRKTCTCRGWERDYAERFKANDLIAAYDRSPRYHGKQIATLRLTHDAYYGTLSDLFEDGGYEAEGFAYYDEQIAAGNAKAAASVRKNLGIEAGQTIREWLSSPSVAGWGEWIIRFEVLSYD